MPAVLLASLFVAAAAFARGPGFEEYRALQESLVRVPPKMRAEWLRKHGLDDSRYTTYRQPESTGLRLVGKYGRGPSVEVTGKDSLVALTLGSEVALISFANPDSPEVLSEIQLSFIPMQSALYDSFLLTCGNGLEVWSIENPRQPVFRHVIPYGVGGFSIVDTFLYFISSDTFFAYSISRPASPYRVGFCRDSGGVTAATRNVAVLRQPGDMLGFVDVTDPTSPHQVGTYPGYTVCADARGNICCAAFYWSTDEDHFRFEVLDISDPANVRRIGAIDSVGGWDIHLSGPFAFVSGFQTSEWEFTIVDLQDSTNPHVISSCATPSNNYGVWAEWTSDRAYVADMTGLAVIDISNLNAPVLDTAILQADKAEDIWIDGTRAYVADYGAGLRILDVANPSLPVELGGIDSANLGTMTAVGHDSFAFAGGWPGPPFRSIEVSDPAHPVMAGAGAAETDPADMVLRDTLLYLAGRLRFNVVNVARPRQPVLVGSCVASDDAMGMWLQDTLAYVGSASTQVFSVANPANPTLVGEFGRGAWNVAVADTVAFLATGVLVWYSVANPAAPVPIDSINLGRTVYGLGLNDTLVYAATLDDKVYVVSVTDLHAPRIVGQVTVPDLAWRLGYEPPYVYAACFGGGVCIFGPETTGVSEARPALSRTGGMCLSSSPVRDRVTVRVSNIARKEVMCNAYTVAGARVPVPVLVSVGSGWTSLNLDLRSASAGVYLLRVRVGKTVYPLRIVKL